MFGPASGHNDEYPDNRRSPNVRRGLRELLIDSFPGSEFFEACNGDEVFAQLLLSRPDLMLLDINMPGRSGFEVLKDVRKSHPRLPVIMVSVQPESQYALRCLQAGATAYINKNSASEELVPAIRKILENAAKLARNPILDYPRSSMNPGQSLA
jgi:DNA-binding NarL/FixJ family response regulator